MMPFRRSLLIPACLAAPLAACGPARNEFAPPCPAPKLVPAIADVTRYAGPSRDLTDLVIQARVVKIDGSCKAGEDKSTVAATVQIGITVLRGPAMPGREADIPVFLAIARGNEVLEEQDLPVHVTFPPNVDRLTMSSPPTDLSLPVSRTVTGASYSIYAGFRLSPAELAANKQANSRR